MEEAKGHHMACGTSGCGPLGMGPVEDWEVVDGSLELLPFLGSTSSRELRLE